MAEPTIQVDPAPGADLEQAARRHAAYRESDAAIAAASAKPFLYPAERRALGYLTGELATRPRVLSLDGGTGRVGQFLDRRGAQVVVTDVSVGMVCAGRRRRPHLRFERTDADELPFAGGSFDGVIFDAGGLDLLMPPRRRWRALEQVHRVLRPGGWFLFASQSLPAVGLGWYRCLGPRKLRWRARQLAAGRALKPEACLALPGPGPAGPGLMSYHARPGRVIETMRTFGFRFERLFTHCLSLALIERTLGVDWPIRLADPWPYFLCRKPNRPAPPRSRAGRH